MKDKLINAIRWIAVLPVSFAALFIAYAIFKLITWFNYGHIGIDYTHTFSIATIIGNFIVNGLSGAAFVLAAAWLAPKAKYATAVVMTTLLIIIGLISMTLTYFTRDGISFLVQIGGIIATCIGGIAYTYTSSDKLKKDLLD